jgi:GT2 family glycosyltransferase
VAARLLVLTPTLGRASTLEAAVASVAAAVPNCRHVLVAPAEQVAALRERFPRCAVLPDEGPENGMWGALNHGLATFLEDADWFTWLNDDDLLLPRFAEMARRVGSDPRADFIAYGDVELINRDDRFLGRVTTTSHPRFFVPLLLSGIAPFTQQGTLVPAQVARLVGIFDPTWKLTADLDFWLRALRRGIPFRHYPLRVARYRVHAGQLSGTVAQQRAEISQLTRRAQPTFSEQALRPVAAVHYRLANLPRYLERWRHAGLRTSRQIFSTPPV